MNPYLVLGVSNSSSVAEIKSAFRRLAKETHPDLNGNNQSTLQKFREIAEAYSILSNPSKRAAYDNNPQGDKTSYDFYNQDDVYNKPYYSASQIEFFISQLSAQVRPLKQKAMINLLKGLAWAIGGILVTYFSYSYAAETGGTYFVTWGAILFGGIQAIRSLWYYSKVNEVVSEAEEDLWRQLG